MFVMAVKRRGMGHSLSLFWTQTTLKRAGGGMGCSCLGEGKQTEDE